MSVAHLLLVAATVAAAPDVSRAQSCSKLPDLMIAMDRSVSIGPFTWAQIKQPIVDLAKTYKDQIRFGMSLFPNPNGFGCDGGKIDVPLGKGNYAALGAVISSTYPSGNTPMGATLNNLLTYLKSTDPGHTKYVLLVTDGYESCHGDPLAAVTALKQAGIKTVVLHYGGGAWGNQLNALAQAGGMALPTAPYYYTSTAAGLSAVLATIAAEVSCCGNGVLDTGELCDPAIAAGQAGACPTACDDKDPCTSDSLTGTGCSVRCSKTTITATKSGDGCCPPGASFATDGDCAPTCGNGKLDSGEVCDPKIAAGAGRCPTAADCEDGDPCTRDVIEGSGCDATCHNQVLGADAEVSDGCCPAEADAFTDIDCQPDCGPDVTEHCLDLCRDVNCPEGQYCSAGSCKPFPNDPAGQSDLDPGFQGTGCQLAGGPVVPSALPAALLLAVALALGLRRRR